MDCKRCGSPLPPDLATCPWCGAQVTDMSPLPPSEDTYEAQFERRLYHFPPVTVALVLVNCLIWLMMAYSTDTEDSSSLVLWGARHSGLVRQGEIWRLVTAGFLHIGWVHLVVNMLTLAQLGLICENVYGRLRYLLIYFLSNLGGFLLGTLLTDSTSAGASASLFGLMGATLTFGFLHRKKIPPFFRPVFTWAMLPWVGIALGYGAWSSTIDNLAHLGGLFTGCLITLPLLTPILSQGETPTPVPLRLGVSLILLVNFVSMGVAGLGIHREWDLVRQQDVLINQVIDPQDVESFGPEADRQMVEWWTLRIAVHPQWGQYLVDRARGWIRLGEEARAERDLRHALDLGHDPLATRNELAWLLLRKGDPDPPTLREGLKLARHVVATSKNSSYLNTLGWAYYLDGQWAEAKEMLEEALEKNDAPDRGFDHFMLAMVAVDQGELAEARTQLKAGQMALAELKEEISEAKTGWDSWLGHHSMVEMTSFEDMALQKIATTSP